MGLLPSSRASRIAVACAITLATNGVVNPLPQEVSPSALAVVQAPPASVPLRLVAIIDESSTTIGVADSSLFFLNDEELAKQLDEIQSLGVTSVRFYVPWVLVESSKGTYDWSQVDRVVAALNARGMTSTVAVNHTASWAGTPITGPFDPADYASFVSALATRYKGQINAYEVWNEPNSTHFYDPNDPTSYTEALKAAYTAIKAADPDATVIAGVLAYWPTSNDVFANPVTFIEQMYAAGAAGYFDALSYHPYQYSVTYSQNTDSNSPANQIAAIRALMDSNGDTAKKIWITEYGVPTYDTITQDQQAAFIKDFIEAWQQQAGAGPIYLYTTRDTNTGTMDPEDNFGLFETDWTAKPAAQVVADLIAQYAALPTPSLLQALQAAVQQFLTALTQLRNAIVSAVTTAFTQMLTTLATALSTAFGGTAATTSRAVSTLAATTTATVSADQSSDATTVVASTPSVIPEDFEVPSSTDATIPSATATPTTTTAPATTAPTTTEVVTESAESTPPSTSTSTGTEPDTPSASPTPTQSAESAGATTDPVAPAATDTHATDTANTETNSG